MTRVTPRESRERLDKAEMARIGSSSLLVSCVEHLDAADGSACIASPEAVQTLVALLRAAPSVAMKAAVRMHEILESSTAAEDGHPGKALFLKAGAIPPLVGLMKGASMIQEAKDAMTKRLSLLHPQLPELDKLLTTALKAKEFEGLVVGPLCKHLSIKPQFDQVLSCAAEAAVSVGLYDFVVTCSADERRLRALLAQLPPPREERKPPRTACSVQRLTLDVAVRITVRTAGQKRFLVRRTARRERHEPPSLLDVLSLTGLKANSPEEDLVFNHLIDSHKADTVLLFTKERHARDYVLGGRGGNCVGFSCGGPHKPARKLIKRNAATDDVDVPMPRNLLGVDRQPVELALLGVEEPVAAEQAATAARVLESLNSQPLDDVLASRHALRQGPSADYEVCPSSDAVFEAGGISPLVALLGAADLKAAEHAAGVLRNLAVSGEATCVAIREAGGIPPLVALLAAGTDSSAAAKAAHTLAALLFHDPNGKSIHDAVREAGAIPALVALLAPGVNDALAARWAAHALDSMTNDHNRSVCCDAVCEAGGIPFLVARITLNESGWGWPTGLVQSAAAVLANLADAGWGKHCDAIREAGGIPPLVALLSTDTDTAVEAAAAFEWMIEHNANHDAIREAGGIPPLVALLSRPDAADIAFPALDHLLRVATPPRCSSSSLCIAAVLTALAANPLPTPPSHAADPRPWNTRDFESLRDALREASDAYLALAELDGDAAALRRAVEVVTAVGQAPGAALSRARGRLEELDGAAGRSARRASLGLGKVGELPDDFVCPITMCPMVDPVVASDGHSYEREAIKAVMTEGNGKSPLTREELQPGVLIPNRALKKRMREHEEEILQAAEKAVAAAAEKAAEKAAVDVAVAASLAEAEVEKVEKAGSAAAGSAASGGAGSSGGGAPPPEPKRARRRR